MIIFWILTLFVGSSSFAVAYIYLQYDVLSSLGFALVAMLLCRGILSIVRRSLILRERMAPEKDTLTRTVETNRAIFWRRALFVAALPIEYFIGKQTHSRCLLSEGLAESLDVQSKIVSHGAP